MVLLSMCDVIFVLLLLGGNLIYSIRRFDKPAAYLMYTKEHRFIIMYHVSVSI